MRVLLIGEDDTSLQDLARGLMFDGYEVWLAENGARGQSLAQTHQPDVIVLNRWSPDAAGVKLCRALIGADRRAPIMILTSGGSRACVEALAAGADDCLMVPYNVGELRARLRTLIHRHAR